MKKLILSIAILAVMTFAACSEDEKDYTPRYVRCQLCDIPEEESYEVCTGENRNAYVGNADTGIEVGRYFALFCANEPIVDGGEDEPDGSTEPGEATDECRTCTVMDIPIEICKGTNGNGFRGGVDSGYKYTTLIQQMEVLGNCE